MAFGALSRREHQLVRDRMRERAQLRPAEALLNPYR